MNAVHDMYGVAQTTESEMTHLEKLCLSLLGGAVLVGALGIVILVILGV